MDKFSLIEFRPYEITDRSFVFATWIKGLKFGNEMYRLIDPIDLERDQGNIIEKLLNEAVTTIACLKEDSDVALGYSVTRGPIIDWVFVKPAWRNLGLASRLLAHIKPQVCSHLTAVGNDIRLKKNIKFNPFTI